MPDPTDADVATVSERLAQQGIDVVRVSYPDMIGVDRGRDVLLDELGTAVSHGLAFCRAVYHTSPMGDVVPVQGGLEEGLPDITVRPDLSTLTPLPWEQGAAWCLGDAVTPDGRSPRPSHRAPWPAGWRAGSPPASATPWCAALSLSSTCASPRRAAAGSGMPTIWETSTWSAASLSGPPLTEWRASRRYDYLKEIAFDYALLLRELERRLGRTLAVPLAEHPGCHAPVVLHNRRLQWIDHDGIHLVRHLHEFGFVDQKPLRAVVDAEHVPTQPLEVHADARAQPAEQHSARPHDAPEFLQHCEEVSFVSGKVQHRATDHCICKTIWKVHLLDRACAEVARR